MLATLRENRRWVVVVGLLIVLVDVRLYVLARDARQHALDDGEAVLRQATDVVLGRMDQLLDTYDRTLSGISEVVSARGGLKPQPDTYLHRLLLRRHALTPGLRWLFLVRENGLLAETSSSFPASSVDVADRDYFRLPAAAWDMELYLGALLRSRVDQKMFIPVSRRLVNDGGRFLGVVTGGIEPAELQNLLRDEALPEGYRLRLLLDSGETLACLPVSDDCLSRNWSATSLFAQWREGPAQGEFRNPEALGDAPGFGAYARSGRYPFLVVATADESRLLTRWRQGLGAYWAIGLGGNLLLAGLAFFAFRQLQRRRQAMADLEDANRLLERRVLERTAELHQREAQARIFMNTALDAVVVIDGDSRIQEFNRAAERMFGYSAAEVVGQPMELLMPAAFARDHREHVDAANHGEAVRAMGRGREVMGRARDGREFPIEVSVGSTSETGIHLHVGIIRDISERRAVELELQRLATTDGLTGLLNRRAFSGEGERLVALARRYGHPLSVMILDADKFKSVNDNHGHPVGDQVLKALARAIEGVLRQTDVFGRLGGEEFGVVLPETDASGATQLGTRLLEAVRACRVPLPQGELGFTVSLGIAVLGPAPDGLESALRRADGALYQAKQGGRDRLQMAGPDASN